MSYGLRASRAKERSRRRRRFWGWFTVLLILVGLGAYSYYTGRELARTDLQLLEEGLAEAETRVETLEADLAAARAAAQSARADAEEWQQRYEADVPAGEGLAIYEEVQRLLSEGVRPERVRLLLEAANRAQSCDPELESKRFGVSSPLTNDPITPVNFAGNAFILSAEGESATLGNGDPAAWFDTEKPVTVYFTEPGGEVTEVTGLLPIQQSFARGDTEYRFAIAYADIRGYVRATLELCSL